MARLALCALAALLLALAPTAASAKPGRKKPPPPVDPQSWELPESMTWDDYTPLPGFDWANDPARQPIRKLRSALILGDFPDRPFLVTQPKGSDPAGNPLVGSIAREDVGQFYEDMLNKPQPLNHGHTINEYWLEDSYGLIGIDLDPFGPYAMDRTEPEYGLAEFGEESACPMGKTCDGDFDSELLAKSLPDVTAATATQGREYLFRFLLHAGYDESGVWQEFGEMKFNDANSVPAEFGGSAPTRYVDWTSFFAAKGIWSHATPGVMATEGENDGQSVYAHEFSHILGVLDNYSNPYAEQVQRDYSGPWDMMSRGSFNGPGGNHNRFQVPPSLGTTMGSHHMLRDKIRMGFTKPAEVMVLDRTLLATTGPAFAEVWQRSIPFGLGSGRSGLHGLVIQLLDGDNEPACTIEEDYRCDGGGYQEYTLEVVNRMGMDSFTPDSGVLIAKNKLADLAPFNWVIDAHPDDIGLVDFKRPDGSVAMVTKGDYRQLADALFHAGTGPGVVSEYVDEANRLHFYVLAENHDKDGVLSYRVAVRSLDGAGPFTRGLTVEPSTVARAAPGRVAVHKFKVTNTGQAEDLVRVAARTRAAGRPSCAIPCSTSSRARPSRSPSSCASPATRRNRRRSPSPRRQRPTPSRRRPPPRRSRR